MCMFICILSLYFFGLNKYIITFSTLKVDQAGPSLPREIYFDKPTVILSYYPNREVFILTAVTFLVRFVQTVECHVTAFQTYYI